MQLQEDCFYFNWKRDNDTQSYPSYEIVFAEFEKRLDSYKGFLKRESLGEIKCRQLELTYVNLIPLKAGSGTMPKTQMFVDHRREESPGRFLPEPESFNWVTSYKMPNSWGRLHVTAMTALRKSTNEPVVQLQITARGIVPGESGHTEASRRAWFDKAHEWITFGFADLTAQTLHENWQRLS